MRVVSFDPKEITEQILADLPSRSSDVLNYRYGLKGDGKKTLEHIGNIFGITRERVRQIENLAKDQIRQNESFIENAKHAVAELEKTLEEFGGVAEQAHLLDTASSSESDKPHLYLLLDLADPFHEEKEDPNFNKVWGVSKNNSKVIKKSLQKLYKDLSKDEIVTESEIIERFMDQIEHDLLEGEINNEIAKRWIKISKKIGKNPMDGWGRADSSSIKTRGVRDYAYLVLREYGKPLHFSELAEKASVHFGKPINTATMHNELIKDERFILVGRGLYYLADSDFFGGTVRELITEILKKDKKLGEDDIIEKVLERKIVKPSTIRINLKNKKYFKYDKPTGIYTLAK